MARKSAFSFAEIIPILPYLAIGVVAFIIYRKVAGGQAGFDLTAPSDIPAPRNLPKPDYVYQTIAERQFNAMNMWGTDSDTLFSSLKDSPPRNWSPWHLLLESVPRRSAFSQQPSKAFRSHEIFLSGMIPN